jgi:glycosyltransferase involved in cell wall biosynthesis
MTKRVIVVTPELPFPSDSGGRKRTLRLIEAIQRAGGEPHVLSSAPRPPVAIDALTAMGIGVDDAVTPPRYGVRTRIEYHARRLPAPIYPAVLARLEELVAEGAAFVQFELTDSAPYARALNSSTTPWVLSLHDIDSGHAASIARTSRMFSPAWLRAWKRWDAMRRAERRYVPVAPLVLAVSEADAAAVKPMNSRVELIPNGVDRELLEISPASGGSDVLFLGTLDYAPNVHGLTEFLVRGWPRVLDSRPDARLRIVGSAANAELTTLADRTPGVDVVGSVPSVATEFARVRCSVVPIWQGGGTRIKGLEALASGRPVVGTSFGLGGVGIVNGVHALLADTPELLAQRLIEVLGDDDLAERLGIAGRRLASSLRWEDVTARVEPIYRDWLATSGRGDRQASRSRLG